MNDELVAVHPEQVGTWMLQFEQPRQALAAISDAEAALERAVEIGDILDLRDKAAGYVVVAMARNFKDVAQRAKIFQLRAERKAGTWLAENVGEAADVRWHGATALPDGVDKYESSRWQLEASLPEERFNEWVDECLAHAWELSAGALRKIAENHNGKATYSQDIPDIAALKRIFRRWWPDDLSRHQPDRDRAFELIAELSVLLMRAVERVK